MLVDMVIKKIIINNSYWTYRYRPMFTELRYVYAKNGGLFIFINVIHGC